MATHRILIVLAAVSGTGACTPTHLNVRVEPPPHASKAGFRAALGPPGVKCAGGGPFVTGDDGVVLLEQRHCDEQWLVVGAPGYITEQRAVDTCDVQLITVPIKPSPPVAHPDDACSVAAQQALQVWLSGNADALRALLVDPDDYEMYRRTGSLDKPWQFTIQGEERGDECSASAVMYFEPGCEAPLRIDLLRTQDGSYKLRGVQHEPQ
jgi:hypothetical protein